MDRYREQTTLSRMLSLDAMRGGAALAVVTYHALGVAPQTAWTGWEGLLPQVTGYIVHFAYAGIYLFFVISGFCIHLFWARSRAAGVQAPVIKFFTFWKRRVRRLYPPYIAALILYLCYLAYKTPVEVTGFYVWDVVLHVFMLHNLDPRTAYTINGAFWTLAIEEQLYLAYFLLLFLRIRYGWATTLVLCFSVRIVWLIMGRTLSHSFGIDVPMGEAAATNWFIWALGALSVEAALGVTKLPAWCYKLRAAAVALGCAIALAQFLPAVKISWLHDLGWLLMHPAWGFGFFILVNYSVAAEQRWRLISSRVPLLVTMLAPIGVISYSLYLTHSFVLMHWYRFGFTELHILSISLVIMTPLSVVFAWMFFRVCERPFMTSAAVQAPVHSKYPAVMVKYATLGLALILAFGFTAVFLVPIKGQEPTTASKASPPKTERRVSDENDFPMVEFSASERPDSKRKARGEKYNKSFLQVHPDSPADSTVIVDSIDFNLPTFPTNKAAAVVTGRVANAKAYLSNDKTGVYSSFVVIIDEVLKNSGKLMAGQSIEVERKGGRVKFPSGRVHLYSISEQHMPVLGGRYVFFLENTSDDSVFEIITGYEIRADAVYALDDLTHAHAYDGSTPANFFKELRMKLPSP